jgi:hypothetical protein
LQGRANFQLSSDGQTTTYKGGAIIQYAPLFSAIGNHEVMGRFSMEKGLGEQFNDPIPRNVADQLYSQNATQINPNDDPKIRAAWIKDHSFNADTYREIFTLPQSPTGGSKYYAVSFGDIRLVVLYATNIWRVPGLGPNDRGRYREKDEHLADPDQWGYGQHIFEAIAPGSPQYEWLVSELNSPEFQQATYKVVMFHHPAHSIGDNVVPAYTDPIQFIDRFPDDTIKAVRYEYPLDADYLARDVLPLLEQSGVYLESSNVGNTYGVFLGGKRRNIPIGYQETYVPNGDPNGLDPVMPTLEPLLDDSGKPMPYLTSDDITAFSILETETGTVSSYRFDTRDPNSPVIKFDEFSLR